MGSMHKTLGSSGLALLVLSLGCDSADGCRVKDASDLSRITNDTACEEIEVIGTSLATLDALSATDLSHTSLLLMDNDNLHDVSALGDVPVKGLAIWGSPELKSAGLGELGGLDLHTDGLEEVSFLVGDEAILSYGVVNGAPSVTVSAVAGVSQPSVGVNDSVGDGVSLVVQEPVSWFAASVFVDGPEDTAWLRSDPPPERVRLLTLPDGVGLEEVVSLWDFYAATSPMEEFVVCVRANRDDVNGETCSRWESEADVPR